MNIEGNNGSHKGEFITKASSLAFPLENGNSLAAWIQKSDIGNINGAYKVPSRTAYTGPAIPLSILQYCDVDYRDTKEHELVLFNNTLKIVHADENYKLIDNNIPDIMNPIIKRIKTHQYECCLSLDRSITSNFTLIKWEETINKMVLGRFSDLENDMIISNEGIKDSIDGIGDLAKYSSKVTDIEVNVKNYQTLIKLYDLILTLKTHMSYEQQSELTLCTSPEILSLLKTIRDANGQLLSESCDSFFKETFLHPRFNTVKNQIVVGNFREYLAIKPVDFHVVKDESKDRAKVINYILNGLTTAILSPKAFCGIRIKFVESE